MNTPVLFLIFNRPDVTKIIFEQIRKVQPKQLFVAADGPRPNKNEEELCSQTRRIIEQVDWDCEVKILFRDKNLGLKKAVTEALNWFFENVEQGIILEDDCLPSQSFFTFCEELLDYYKDDKRVWHISGDQFIENFNNEASYYFASIEHCWGWATWADRWQNFKLDMPNFNDNMQKIEKNIPQKFIYDYWFKIFEGCKNNKINSWAYIWTYTILKENGLCINPSVNLVSNIGFEGTHYSDIGNNPLLNIPIYEIDKIIHPHTIQFDEKAVEYIYSNVFMIKETELNKKQRTKVNELFKYITRRPLFMFNKQFYKLLIGIFRRK